MVKKCSGGGICADDWRSNSKCVGKYSIASSRKGGRRKAIAIYDGGMGVSVPTFLLGLVVWYVSFFASGYADADDIIGL